MLSKFSEKMNDIDRVMQTLDGNKHQPRSFETAARQTMGKEVNTYEDEYYKLKAFKNGNVHIWFKRLDLLEKLNKVISEYYNGQALASGGR